MQFIVTTDHLSALALSCAARESGGKPLCSCWIVPWSGTADSLAIKLRHVTRSSVVVCLLEDDWSYR